ncbi:Rhodanese-like domain-containing protein [Rhodovastum atsumiense]|uniref:Rhodanese-like domain-containing protein n=1 Tax=Rhodovastum atsumiense TaxID=504468 RepID=A0A5M6ILT8_9PROT|nr:rhodanese-like domain-containing protein [Rhodovastum atsumiense]KAA5609240.1 rhodanese-like domain-containing protein [Rhodovastum atsumiense]CAH2601691.1 Rhodanese-like domain-containing protein [Rhodovastum atsumiense]
MSPVPHEMTPVELQEALQRHSIVLVDVREPDEYRDERIPGALLFPLSSFDPAALPVGGGREVVLHCGIGKRSALALARCAAAGVAVTAHLQGGLAAWKQAALPTLSGAAAPAAHP